jgi:hypothetical protein
MSKRGRPGQRVLPGARLQGSDPSLGWWHLAEALLPVDEHAYQLLREAALGNQHLGVRPLLTATGVHYRKLDDIFDRLARRGFITCTEPGKVIPAEVVVHPVPRMPDSPQEQAAVCNEVLKLRGPLPTEVNRFLAWYAVAWATTGYGNGLRYPGEKKEYAIARWLLRQCSLEELQRCVREFFLHDGVPAFKLAQFKERLPDVQRCLESQRRERETLPPLPTNYPKALLEDQPRRRVPPPEPAQEFDDRPGWSYDPE